MQTVWLAGQAGVLPDKRSGLPVREVRNFVDIYNSSVASAVCSAFYCTCIVFVVSDVEDIAVGVDHLHAVDDRPCGVLVSIFSLELTRVTPLRCSTSTMLSRSLVERLSLLMLSMYRVSPSRTYSSMAFSSGLSAFLPDIFSANTRST